MSKNKLLKRPYFAYHLTGVNASSAQAMIVDEDPGSELYAAFKGLY